MCGIIAALTSSSDAKGLDDFIRDGLIASQVRGLHSTGLFQLMPDHKSFRMSKRAVTASEFVDLKPAQDIISAAPKHPLTVGHVRHATVGAKTDVNAHPFVAADKKHRIVGVHNGTLQGWRFKEGGDKKSVDSDWAFQKFLEEGPIDAFEYFNGAYAFVWHDTDYPDHVFMARNDERPLHFFVDDDSPTILVASELGMLGWMADRCGYRRSKDASKAQFFYLRPDKVYKFSLKEIGKYEEIDRPKYDPTTTLEAPATPPATRIYPTQQVPWYDNDDYDSYDWYGRSRRRYGSHSGGWNRGQRSVLANVKEALAEARNEISGDEKGNSEVVGTEELDERLSSGIKNAIQSWERERFDAWALCGEYHRIENPNSRNVSTSEMEAARKMGLFGMAAAFTAVIYDDETSETLGDAYIKVPGLKGVHQYDCILRGLSKAAADAQYINKTEAVPVAIVGVCDGIRPNSNTLIISPLRKEELETLKQKIKAPSCRVN